jgi:hypothetical protein
MRKHHHGFNASIAAPGPYDFAVRIDLFVGASKPRCKPIRPSHPASHARDDRDTPLLAETGRDGDYINSENRKAQYFSREGWTGSCEACPSGKSLSHDLVSDMRACSEPGRIARPESRLDQAWTSLVWPN